MNKSISGQLNTFSLSNTRNYLLLFMLWPFLALIAAITNYSQKESKKVVYIFLIYYGLTFVLGNIGVDAEGYVWKLKMIAALPFSDFFKIVGGLYSSDTSVDIIEPLISFIVSRFTTHPGAFFGVWAAIFGFFYLKSIDKLHESFRKSPGSNAMIFLAFFTVIIPITTINGVRMYTAAWIFFYGAYHVILYRDPRYLLIAIASSLVHFSFLSANLVLIIYFIAGNRNFIYLPLALISFILPQLIAPVFQLISLRLGGAIQNRYEGYTNEDYLIAVQDMQERASWFLKISSDLIFYFLLLSIIVIQFKPGISKEKNERNLFSFLLLFLAFVNFGKAIPALGGRFQTIFYLFATLYIFLHFLKMPGNKLSILTLVGLFPMLLYVAIQFRIGSESINAWIFTPGFGMPLLAPGLSIADLLFH
jgi:hypothetical protein